MGNSRNSHACRGKYGKKKVPMTRKGKCNDKVKHNGSRIINLGNLQEQLQVIRYHAATCQPCMDNTLSGNEAIVLIVSTIALDSVQCFLSLCRLPYGIPGLHIIKSARHECGHYWECNLAAVWGQMATRGKTCTTEGVSGCTWHIFRVKKVIHVH